MTEYTIRSRLYAYGPNIAHAYGPEMTFTYPLRLLNGSLKLTFKKIQFAFHKKIQTSLILLTGVWAHSNVPPNEITFQTTGITPRINQLILLQYVIYNYFKC